MKIQTCYVLKYSIYYFLYFPVNRYCKCFSLVLLDYYRNEKTHHYHIFISTPSLRFFIV